jgi:prepilin-type N-terminal cleavage/methylation domain-containing protein
LYDQELCEFIHETSAKNTILKKLWRKTMSLKKLHDNRGFSLVELMIAVCIMAIAFAGLITMETACINGNSIASNVTMGITLAQDKMEELNSVDYNDPRLNDANPGNNGDLRSTTSIDFSESDIDEQGNAGGIYTRIWNVADDTPTVGQKTIVVIVTWKNHNVTVTSII